MPRSPLSVVRATALAAAVCGLVGTAAIAQSPPLGAPVGKLIDPNSATETTLAEVPGLTPAIAKTALERRPFKTIVEFNRFLLDQKLTAEQTKALYAKVFVPINLNTGTREEFTLIPGVGPRMSSEFMEYRPWKTWTQFDKEIGKYVGQQETDRFKQYVFIPAN